MLTDVLRPGCSGVTDHGQATNKGLKLLTQPLLCSPLLLLLKLVLRVTCPFSHPVSGPGQTHPIYIYLEDELLLIADELHLTYIFMISLIFLSLSKPKQAIYLCSLLQLLPTKGLSSWLVYKLLESRNSVHSSSYALRYQTQSKCAEKICAIK